MNENLSTAVYVYGFLRVDQPKEEILSQPGIGIASDTCLLPPRGGVSAIVCSVPRVDFCGEVGESNLSNVGWLAPRVVRHQNVIEAAMDIGPVLPVRFGTLFSSRDALFAFIEERMSVIASFFDRIEGRQEWAVQGFIDPSTSRSAWVARHRSAGTSAGEISAGAAFMREELLRKEVEKGVEDMTNEKCEALLETLAQFVDESCERRLLPKDPDGPEREMVVNWAFLVADDNVADFSSRVEDANRECVSDGLSFNLSGPWPVYSFCPNLSDEDAANAEDGDV
jgi:hypothetical protein